MNPESPDAPQRLSKAVAALVPCSRREAELYISQGRVRVDGQPVDEPQFRVVPGQRVEVDRAAAIKPDTLATMLLHKPAGMSLAQAQSMLVAANHWPGDTSGVRRAKSHSVGLQILMPLPQPASGLAIFSQDGRIIRKLQEDARLMEQELLAEVSGTIADNGLARLCRGLMHDGQPMPPARVSWQSEKRLRFAMKSIPCEAVPWMCEQVGLRLEALRRIRVGRISMAGLPLGQWRYLAEGEKF